MSDTAIKEEIEITEPETPPAPETPTRDDLKSKGWSAAELEAAEKRGMIQTPEDVAKKKADEEAKAKAEAAAKTKVDGEDKGEEGKTPARRAEDKIKSTLPDFTFQTPEQEKAFLDAFGPGTPQRAMYFRMKNERQAKQAERKAREAAEKRAADLEARLAELEKGAKPQEFDENGNPIDPEDKPLTLKEWKAIQQKEKDEQDRKAKENEDRARTVAEAHETQEGYMREAHDDFDETMELAKDLMRNLDTYVPERWKQAQIVAQIRQLQVAAAQADKIDLDDNHAARIAYEIGKLHPKYGKTADEAPNGDTSDKDGKSNDPKKVNGGLTPEQMKRIAENTTRRASSASVSGGGGKRTVSVDDVDLATINRWSYAERQKFREKYPDRYAKLLRG